ncbi:hypothetical protein JW824_06685 [bacterium]|nr:hypothetical protein [bacterium]RQV95553.1 MAG: hypothetical protein EH221_06175 [bacterium]
MKKLGKYSIGIGDRFACQGKAQLQAVIKTQEWGIDITPVWNKSYREHEIIHSHPADTRRAADEAVRLCNWKKDYFVDADHVGVRTVDLFIDTSDFFTIDVADFIGEKADQQSLDQFHNQHQKYVGPLKIPNLPETISITYDHILEIAETYLRAVEEAGKIHRHITSKKGTVGCIIEISMDETSKAQTPIELFFILSAIARENIPVQTIAPKFTGQFYKGIDYMGNVDQFSKEFETDLAVIDFAVGELGLPANLKLSMHSGSDKFSLYPSMKNALKKYNAGLHLKTAGTTWLEEVIGLAESGGEGLAIAKIIYRQAYHRIDELSKPYANVIDIDFQKLPSSDQVDLWDGLQYASALKHDPTNLRFNPHFRQLIHIGYKIAAEMKARYLAALKQYEKTIARHVTENIYENHLKRLFDGLGNN